MPIPIDPRKKPASIKIHITTGAGVDIVWADNHTSHYDFPYLREECPCATCRDERGEKNETPASPPAILSSPALPMFKPKPKATAATSVGNYAIQFTFNDGHATGIYSYDHLRTICPCQDCAQAFRSPAS